ncbi:MAG: hypothetical protein IPM42_08640 [Saprospiraceae bacterium]|nr:hypothetical protein [Saprospiraceae bacterium]
MKKVIQITLLFSVACCLSCGKSENELRKEAELLIAKNKAAILALDLKYDCKANWDSAAHFTYNLQDMFLTHKNPINLMGKIVDITKVDSIYHVMVHTGWEYEREYFADISIEEKKFIDFKKSIKSPNRWTTGSFVFKVSNISSKYPKLDCFERYLDYDESLIIFSGDLIDFYFNEFIDSKIN